MMTHEEQIRARIGKAWKREEALLVRGRAKEEGRKLSSSPTIEMAKEICPGLFLSEKSQRRFWGNVLHLNECWIWCGHISLQGYGVFKTKGRPRNAHRLSYSLLIGKIPDGMHVCHTCDVRPCVNPMHLFLGTPLDNMRDMIIKGRANHLRGSERSSSKLTEIDAVEIYVSLLKQRELAVKYGVSDAVIRDIKKRKSWKLATADLGPPGKRVVYNRKIKPLPISATERILLEFQLNNKLSITV